MTAGYADAADHNAEAFRDGWFRTGDQGYVDSDGYLFLTGRLKEIINRGGEKISPREIDEILHAHPEVSQAVTFALPDERLGQEVGAAVVLECDARITELALKEFVAGRVADFKVPRRIAILDEIPKGPTGKLQRIGLGERLGLMMSSARVDDVPFHDPETPTEALVHQLWRDVLGLDRVGTRDSFFSIGGDSILATQFTARLLDATGTELSLVRFFDDPTVHAVARWLDETRQTVQNQVPEPIGQRPATPQAIPSFAEERMWFADEFTEEPAILNPPALFRLRGPLDTDALTRSLTGVVTRHEILRTTYHNVEGRVVPVVGPPQTVVVPSLDLTDAPDADRDARVSEIVRAEGRRTFDLSTDLMLRASVLRIRDDEHLLFVNFHHIASDGWSSRVLLRELAALYTACRTDRPVPLPALPIQYSDYAHWQRQRLQGDGLAEHLLYWKQTLEGLPALLELPADRSRPPKRTHRGGTQTVTLPRELAAALSALGARDGTTLFMTLLAGFQLLLARHTGRTDFLIGTVTANRSRRETEPLIGLFMNILAIRSNVEGELTFRELLARVRTSTVAAYEQQDVPFHEIVGTVNPQRRMDVDPVIQVLFQFRNLPSKVTEAHDLTVEELDVDLGVAEFDLTLETRECLEGIQCRATYNADLFEPETIGRLLGHYATLLEAAVTDPDGKVSALPLLTEPERHTMLVEWNDNAKERPDVSVTELFEHLVARTPDGTALQLGDATLSYRELNQRANRLAHRLRRLGVDSDARVALCLERSFELLVGILGTLKAGAAYVPLDPEYPRQRLSLMLEDASPFVVLTTENVQDRVPPHDAHTVLLDETTWAPGEEAEDNLPRVAGPEDAAYVIYTSG